MSPEPSEWTLHAWGKCDWATIRELVGQAMCAWADYGGFRIGPSPDSAPPYSHLWAWEGEEVLYRVRIDEDAGVIAALVRSGDHHAGQPPIESHAVEVLAYSGIPWRTDGQIGQVATQVLASVTTIALYETLELVPMTFARVNLVQEGL